ncbi:MAG TPA: hypothetical protein VER76_11455 [Pyrinomonadaceae bacterium]|nr:hypothetical protein [Pyrinomonadaceae bacterium]
MLIPAFPPSAAGHKRNYFNGAKFAPPESAARLALPRGRRRRGLWYGRCRSAGKSFNCRSGRGVVLALYPLCRWFTGVKRRRRAAWLSYL